MTDSTDRQRNGSAVGAPDITHLLERWRNGDVEAQDRLVAAIYPVLREMSGRQLSRNAGATLSATEVVHESYFRLIEQRDVNFASRAHFFAIAAHVMRRVLVDHWRERAALKRGGALQPVTLDLSDVVQDEAQVGVDVLDLDQLLERLERVDVRAARLVELRFFAGMSIDEAAVAMDLSRTTAKRDWQFARAWLQTQWNDHPRARAP